MTFRIRKSLNRIQIRNIHLISGRYIINKLPIFLLGSKGNACIHTFPLSLDPNAVMADYTDIRNTPIIHER